MARTPLPATGQATQILARLHHEDRGATRLEQVFINAMYVALVVLVVSIVTGVVLVVT